MHECKNAVSDLSARNDVGKESYGKERSASDSLLPPPLLARANSGLIAGS